MASSAHVDARDGLFDLAQIVRRQLDAPKSLPVYLREPSERR